MRFGKIVAGVLLKHGVEVRAAEAEGADAGHTRLGTAVNPRPRLGIEEEGTLLEVRLAVGVFDEQRRQYLVMQRQSRVDKSGEAGGAFGVTDHRLNGADNARSRRRTGLTEDLSERCHLRLIADHRTRTVRLDKLDTGR